MHKPLHLIYIPGLGDAKIKRQKQAVSLWRLWGIRSEIVQMNWHTGSWDEKLTRILTAIDDASAKGYAVGLVGASAGGGAVINAYALRKNIVVGIVLIAGKINRPHAIGGTYRLHHSPFVDSANAAVESLQTLTNRDRKRILSRFAILDPVVPAIDSCIPGAHNRIVPTVGHVFTIATQLLIGAPTFIGFLKRQARHRNR